MRLQKVGSGLVYAGMIPLSLTRLFASSLIKCGTISSFGGILTWNILFYTVALTWSYICFFVFQFQFSHKHLLLVVMALLALTRVNELVFAFYGDALARKSPGSASRLPIKSDGRIILLTLAYFEVLLQFAIVYASIQGLYPLAFKDPFVEFWDAVYFSGVTLTTTGYGDFTPQIRLAKLATMYEALVGVVFIALALAAYLGGENTAAPEKTKTKSNTQPGII